MPGNSTLRDRVSQVLFRAMLEDKEWLSLRQLRDRVQPSNSNVFGVTLWRMEHRYKSIRVDRSLGYHRRRFAFPISHDECERMVRRWVKEGKLKGYLKT